MNSFRGCPLLLAVLPLTAALMICSHTQPHVTNTAGSVWSSPSSSSSSLLPFCHGLQHDHQYSPATFVASPSSSSKRRATTFLQASSSSSSSEAKTDQSEKDSKKSNKGGKNDDDDDDKGGFFNMKKQSDKLSSSLADLFKLISKEDKAGIGLEVQAEEDGIKLAEFKAKAKNEVEDDKVTEDEEKTEGAAAVTNNSAPPQQQQQDSSMPPSMIGRTVLDGQYVLKEKFRIGSMKCEIFIAYHINDLETKKRPVAIKLTNGYPDYINIEYKVYNDIYKRLGKEEASKFFVKVYDWIPQSSESDDRCGFLMDCGYENLRSFMFRNGPFTDMTLLRKSMEHVIRIVNALHKEKLVWTEVKAENFIVMFPTTNNDDDKTNQNIENIVNGKLDINTMIKGADLESMCGHMDNVRVYSAEVYPPEFPTEDLYNGPPPKIPLEYSFDVWGLGMVLFEMVTGEPLLTLQKTYDVEYIKERLRNPQDLVDEVHTKLDSMTNIDDGAKEIVKKCLVVDPKQRCSCEDLLNDNYFQQEK